MTEEFDLSEKKYKIIGIEGLFYPERDVKEFIKKIKILGNMRLYRSKSCQLLIRQISKLAGEKLI